MELLLFIAGLGAGTLTNLPALYVRRKRRHKVLLKDVHAAIEKGKRVRN